jgi:predicted transcriptional regulator
MSVTSVRLQADVERQLEAVAAELKRSKSWVINQALQEFAERRQLEQQRWRDTLAALEDVRDGRVATGASVHAWLDTWGTPDESASPGTDR